MKSLNFDEARSECEVEAEASAKSSTRELSKWNM